ncbi:hypothetical protein Poli38472_009556 [Pythium oligandrum]|uniref:Uncharacterized protein n=1 Tax=Pythium oligandrum TaxID=41045 RepID=A0A8K1CGF7_PYTOL|nr:hypothetical protein Poli38472_009556 [Pythium oligandrum]|eukprot:TMW62063.1 hypothetical protein Poli38472_009556 [Pythium oligandrum]
MNADIGECVGADDDAWGDAQGENAADMRSPYDSGDDADADSDSVRFQRRETDGESDDDDEGEDQGILAAFEAFNLRAEKRVHELLQATQNELFSLNTSTNAENPGNEADIPSYILMSDQYRLVQPPSFADWQSCFPYLEIVGANALAEAPDEHIQIRPPPPLHGSHTNAVDSRQDTELPLEIRGQAYILRPDTSDPPQEEIILADGESEEFLEEDRTEEVENLSATDRSEDRPPRLSPDREPPSGWLSPRTSRVEETLGKLTLDCFSSMVAPMAMAIFRRMLEKQQHNLRGAREQHEDATQRAYEETIARKEAERRRQEQEKLERAAYEAAAAKAVEEERIREEARIEELARLQREENDEEEIKIRTLAYSHTREWYQPDKKCFSHRGRKMTYLKPVLDMAKDGETADAEPTKVPQRPRVSLHVKKRSSPSKSLSLGRIPGSPKPPRKNSGEKERSSSSRGEQCVIKLPQIGKRATNSRGTTSSASSPQWNNRPSISVAVAAPSRVYAVSPYRIPPAILQNEPARDPVATTRKQQQQQLW